MSNKNQWGGARKGAGAPVTVGEEGRRKPRAIQMNNDEYAALKAAAEKAGMSISEYARMKLFNKGYDIMELLINGENEKCTHVYELPNKDVIDYEPISREATDAENNYYSVTKVTFTNGDCEYMAERLYNLSDDKEYKELTDHIYD